MVQMLGVHRLGRCIGKERTVFVHVQAGYHVVEIN